jgi:hypothetical protein
VKLTTQQDLRDAKKAGVWTLKRNSAFCLRRSPGSDNLRGPTAVLKAGTVVRVEKIYRRGRAAPLCYPHPSGEGWWSWTHAAVYEPPRSREHAKRS